MKPRSPNLPIWPPFAIFLLSGGYLVSRWLREPVPAMQAVAPIVLIGLGIGVCALLEGVTALNLMEVKGERKKDIEPEAAVRIGGVAHELVRRTELALALSFSFGTVMGTHSKAGVHPAFPVVTLGLVALALWSGSRRLVVVVRELKEQGLGRGLDGYNGLTYRNKEDPRIWVPKIGGIGYTLNFAHGMSYAILGMLLFPVAVLVLLGFYIKPS